MNKLSKAVLPAVLIGLVASSLMGQITVKKVAQTGMKFLSVPVGAQGAGMGNAFIAVANNGEAMFWNPAGMTKVKGRFDFSAGYNKWIAAIKHQYADFTYNAGNTGVFGINLIWVDYGTIYGTRRSEVDPRGYIETGTFSPQAFAIGLAYGRAITDKFSFGVNLKYVRQDLGLAYVGTGETTEEFETVSNRLSVMAFDFGTLFYPGFKDLRIAMSIRNVSAERYYVREGFPIPITFKLGIAMDLMKAFGAGASNPLIFAIDAVHPRDYAERVHFGVEYWFNDIIALRAGYKLNYDEDKFSVGMGFKHSSRGIRVDYALNTFGSFDAVHRISLGGSF